MDPKLWMDAAEEAQDKEFHGKYDIWGGDIDPAAVELARHNAALAGVEDCVRFEEAEKREAEALYRAFGKALEDLPPKWRVIVLSSHTEFERCFGRPADRKRKLYNGMLKCDAFVYGR